MNNKMYLDDEEYFIPPEEVAQAASKGLALKEKFNRGGTEIGWARAKQLSTRQKVSFTEMKRISSYFARHEVDKNAKNFGNEGNPSKGYIAWLLWGGEPGKKWVQKVIHNSLKDSKT